MCLPGGQGLQGADLWQHRMHTYLAGLSRLSQCTRLIPFLHRGALEAWLVLAEDRVGTWALWLLGDGGQRAEGMECWMGTPK